MSAPAIDEGDRAAVEPRALDEREPLRASRVANSGLPRPSATGCTAKRYSSTRLARTRLCANAAPPCAKIGLPSSRLSRAISWARGPDATPASRQLARHDERASPKSTRRWAQTSLARAIHERDGAAACVSVDVALTVWSRNGSPAGAPLTPIARGREIELALERAVEGGLRFVASVQGNLKHGIVGRLEQAGPELHATARDIGEWSLAKQPGEPFPKDGAGHAGSLSQRRDRPGVRRLVVDRAERAAYRRIARGGEPSGPLPRQFGHVTA